MREIKFKYIWKHDNGTVIEQIHTLEDIEIGEIFLPHHGEYTLVARRQYSGRKDKNRNEIYEKDILGLPGLEDDSKVLIVFEKGAFRKSGQPWGYDFLNVIDDLDEQMWIVIGNLYQNPELIPNKRFL